jgi:D-3-phosphoglycerate dehydrogenase
VGNIGKAVVRRARAFGARVICTDPVPLDSSFIAETEVIPTSLDEVLAAADFLSLHCDLNPTSFHLLGAGEFNRMKRSACVINTARGPIIDEVALIEILREKRIAGAALDVFEVEPLPEESPLRQFPNCLLAPHNANSSFEARRRVHESTIENLLKGLREA